MTSQGSPYARFRRALSTGNLAIIRAAAAELPRIELRDALAVCAVIRERQPDDFERAALRWLARYATERHATLCTLRVAVESFEAMRRGDQRGFEHLRSLCR